MPTPRSPRWASATPARPSSTPRGPTSSGARGRPRSAACLDLADRAGAAALLRGHDVAVDALPARASPLAIHAALKAGTPVVCLSARGAATIPGLAEEAARRGGLVVLGCGLEPGLAGSWRASWPSGSIASTSSTSSAAASRSGPRRPSATRSSRGPRAPPAGSAGPRRRRGSRGLGAPVLGRGDRDLAGRGRARGLARGLRDVAPRDPRSPGARDRDPEDAALARVRGQGERAPGPGPALRVAGGRGRLARGPQAPARRGPLPAAPARPRRARSRAAPRGGDRRARRPAFARSGRDGRPLDRRLHGHGENDQLHGVRSWRA